MKQEYGSCRGGQAESGARAPLATRVRSLIRRSGQNENQETTFAEEFLERVESLGQAISGILRPWNVVKIYPGQHDNIAGKRRRRSVCA